MDMFNLEWFQGKFQGNLQRVYGHQLQPHVLGKAVAVVFAWPNYVPTFIGGVRL